MVVFVFLVIFWIYMLWLLEKWVVAILRKRG